MDIAVPLVFPEITGFTVTNTLAATLVQPPDVTVLLK
jgi:hypothetical protein